MSTEFQGDAVKKLVTMLESAKAKLDLATRTKSNLLAETSKVLT